MAIEDAQIVNESTDVNEAANEITETQVVRVMFNIDTGVDYFVDKPFDESQEAQANCDKILLEVADAMKQGIPLACMRKYVYDGQERIKPVILNLRKITEIQFDNVGVYKVNVKEETE